MRILITGGTGQVGGALVGMFSNSHTVIAPPRDEFDLLRPRTLAAGLDRMAPMLIINPAAYTAVDRAEDERELAYRVNAEAPFAIAHWAASHGVPLIHFSTDYVFNGNNERPWREDDSPRPLSIYGASKLAGEEAVRSAGVPHLIIRTSWVYAARGANFLSTVVRLGRERNELRIVADQYGAPTTARLIANVVVAIIRSEPESLIERFAAAGGIINVAASGETTWHGFAYAIIAGLRARGFPLLVENIVPIATDDYPTKARRPANSRLDLRRLTGVFGIVTPNWNVGLADELDEFAFEISHVDRR
jgi:dTDP-4-dehydrorhamnose reductase